MLLSVCPIYSIFKLHQLISLLGSFLHNNYKQALSLLDGAPALARTMLDLGVEDEATFAEWLSQEKEYLMGLTKEPLVETLEMEYYEKLTKLTDSQ